MTQAHTSTEQPEALPCPFCGGHSTLDSNGKDFRVFCWDCGAKSKEFDCWQKAEAAWNRRAPASQAQRGPLPEAIPQSDTLWAFLTKGMTLSAISQLSNEHDKKVYLDRAAKNWAAIRSECATQEKQG